MTPKHLLRKSVGPARYADKQIVVNDTTDVKAVIDKALGIIKHQVNTLSARAHNNGLLDNDEVKNLRTYVQSLVDLSKEERERAKHDGVEEYLANMSLDELVALAQGKVNEIEKSENAIQIEAKPEST